MNELWKQYGALSGRGPAESTCAMIVLGSQSIYWLGPVFILEGLAAVINQVSCSIIWYNPAFFLLDATDSLLNLVEHFEPKLGAFPTKVSSVLWADGTAIEQFSTDQNQLDQTQHAIKSIDVTGSMKRKVKIERWHCLASTTISSDYSSRCQWQCSTGVLRFHRAAERGHTDSAKEWLTTERQYIVSDGTLMTKFANTDRSARL